MNKRKAILILWSIKLGFELARRDVVNRFKWSKLGFFWPMVSFGIYAVSVSIVYSKVFNLELKTYLPYLITGIASWMFVQSFFVEGVNLLLTFKGLIVNINLPYVIYYLALVIKSLIILILQIPIISIVKLQFGQDFAPGLFFLPLSITLLSFLGIVIAKIVSILGIISRDLAHLMPSIITILTLVTPILFPISLLSNAKWIYEFNPMYYLISIIRDPLMGIIPNENHFKVCLLILIILYFCSLVLENKLQKKIVPMI